MLCAAIAAAALVDCSNGYSLKELQSCFRSRLLRPARHKKKLGLAAGKTLAKNEILRCDSLAPSTREHRQTILAGLAGRLAHDLHAVALGTKHRIHKGLPLLRREALEAGRHDAHARTARLDGLGLERR